MISLMIFSWADARAVVEVPKIVEYERVRLQNGPGKWSKKFFLNCQIKNLQNRPYNAKKKSSDPKNDRRRPVFE